MSEKNLDFLLITLEVLAHSCGVKELRQLRRYHARMVTENSKSIPLDELYPKVKPLAY